MTQKCLIAYASRTKNTEKVALRFKQTFEKHGWECDAFRITKKMVKSELPFDFKEYDFVCVGSGIGLHQPYPEILACIRMPRYGVMPENTDQEPPPDGKPSKPPKGKGPVEHHKIVLGPDSKKSVVFVTYSGYDLGPKEADPALSLLALEIEHNEFECIGQFACLGKFVNEPTPETFWGDIRDRPNERDLMKAEIFIEETLEAIRPRNV